MARCRTALVTTALAIGISGAAALPAGAAEQAGRSGHALVESRASSGGYIPLDNHVPVDGRTATPPAGTAPADLR
ncbi:hypothetical protein [Streptomyces sp. TP-A0874]|uniref:hypothetical protein n=1 Tax=Streptomyces sp. TP-A0874 TaxID=549819 RepID=UPI0008533FBC|nr:hypothetical protein [Streptomyces sp. TP-A0874]